MRRSGWLASRLAIPKLRATPAAMAAAAAPGALRAVLRMAMPPGDE